MTKPFQDNPEKSVVRRVWDTPLLEHLHRKYKVRYRYLGLPGVDLIALQHREGPGLQPLVQQPEPVALPHQQLHPIALAVEEHKHVA